MYKSIKHIYIIIIIHGESRNPLHKIIYINLFTLSFVPFSPDGLI